MESSSIYPQFHHNSYGSPPSHHRNLRRHGGVCRRSSMRIFPNLQRITTVVNQSHRNPIQHPLTITSQADLTFDPNLNSTMDDSNAKKEMKSADDSIVVKGAKESQKPPEKEIPPPPEKPLAGDCCGSGCVRCVWDVYYEELEEYNKLCKGGSDSSVGSKVS